MIQTYLGRRRLALGGTTSGSDLGVAAMPPFIYSSSKDAIRAGKDRVGSEFLHYIRVLVQYHRLRAVTKDCLAEDFARYRAGWILVPSETLTTPFAKDNAWRRHIGPKLEAIGLDWVNFHVLRRSHWSLMRDHNVDPKIVADQQGHTLDVNLNVYTETSLERRIEAVQQLESAMVN